MDLHRGHGQSSHEQEELLDLAGRLPRSLSSAASGCPFINNIYHSVNRSDLEDYLYKLVYRLIKDVVDEEAKPYVVREEDKVFIADFYKYAFVGLALDWIKDGMAEDPSLVVARVGTLIRGTIVQALKNYQADAPLDKLDALSEFWIVGFSC
jgi:hypothetical protein